MSQITSPNVKPFPFRKPTPVNPPPGQRLRQAYSESSASTPSQWFASPSTPPTPARKTMPRPTPPIANNQLTNRMRPYGSSLRPRHRCCFTDSPLHTKMRPDQLTDRREHPRTIDHNTRTPPYRPGTPPVPRYRTPCRAPKPCDITTPPRHFTPAPPQPHPHNTTPRQQTCGSPIPHRPLTPVPTRFNPEPEPVSAHLTAIPIDFSPARNIRLIRTPSPLTRSKRLRTPIQSPERPHRPLLSPYTKPHISRRHGISIATLNCQSLVTNGHPDTLKLQEIALFCKTNAIQILAIQEHKIVAPQQLSMQEVY
ncbi:Hypothetical protein, putative [Bodo saltans]|uniref:Uncharacterized protein n=1 Tax=Bodo saltans TaxID=75058 RepID=A0A0S4JE95_BODSA|nr:Hypothetical protein, putative [Bodo saltans]|eukprot:CUG86689.1 Hypothetical protein, putative [Bodo saltans]